MAKEPAAKKRRLSPPGDDTKSAPGFTRWNLEQDYEKRARKGKKEQKNEKLPIKTAEGDVVRQEEKEPEVAQKDDDADSFLASDDGEEEEQEQEKSEETGPKLSPKEEILQAKEELARMASVMSEDPEDNIGLLASIAEITMSKNVVVKKLGMGTMLAIFKDIIPGYRIRPLGRDDLTSKVSKDVRKLRTFEQGLLNAYKSYLQLLKGLAKGSASGDADAAGLASVAIACACTLLENVSHFNERSVLVAIVVGKLSVRNPTAKDQDYTRCLNALEHTFKDDDDGYISLEIVGQLTKMMKTRNWQCHESVLNSLLHLRLLNEFSGKASSERVDKAEKEEPVKKPTQKKVFRTKRERKVMRERKEVEKEMSVADAAVSYEERDKNQAETLKLVFLAYFRILKARVDHLMGAVLEGLARYAHLINQEFFGDILEVLKDLINEASVDLQTETGDDLDENRNATRETLLCITTAFALLHGQMDVIKSASSLHLDLDFFIKTLYNIILPLSQDPDLELSAKNGHARDPNGLSIPATLGTKVNVATTTVLFLRSLQAVLLPPTNTRSVPPLRVAAFVKQLCTAALHLPQKSSVATIGLLQQVSKTHSKKMMALWHTEDRKGDGVFDPLGKLESANPLAATVWEGELLRLHFDPKVRDTVKQLEKNMRGD